MPLPWSICFIKLTKMKGANTGLNHCHFLLTCNLFFSTRHRHDGSQTSPGQPRKPAHADERWGIPSITHTSIWTHKTNDTSLYGRWHFLGDIHGILLLCIRSPDLHLILDRFFFFRSLTKSVYQHFFFLSFCLLLSCIYICLRCFWLESKILVITIRVSLY